MIEFGKTLRRAREAKGYTVSQLAEMTRMIHQVVEDLENENFSRIAAPIYGRGFVKLYCEAVEIDPKALIEEFMAIYNGQRELGIKERAVSPASAPRAPEPEVEPAPEPAMTEPEAEPSMPPVAVAIPPAAAAGAGIRQSAPMPLPTGTETPADAANTAGGASRFARYASPLREMNMPSIAIPPSVWRIAVLATVGLVILFLLFSGLKALYRATTTPVAEPERAETASAGRPAETGGASAAAAAADIKRTPVKVPSLYID